MAAVYETDSRRAAGLLQLHTELFLCEISPSLEAVPLNGWVRGRVGETTEGGGEEEGLQLKRESQLNGVSGHYG